MRNIKDFIIENTNVRPTAKSKVGKLVEKWKRSGLLEDLSTHDTNNMAIMLENESRYLYKNMFLKESTTMGAGDVEGFSSVAFPLVRRAFGKLIASKLVTIQPISMPSGLIFFLDFTYDSDRLSETADTSVFGGGVVGRQLSESGIFVDDSGNLRYGELGFQAMNNGYSSATGTITEKAITQLAAPFEIGATTTSDAQMRYLDWDPQLESGSWATVLQVELSAAEWQTFSGENLIATIAYNTGGQHDQFSGSTQVRRLTSHIQESGIHKLNFVFHNTGIFNTLTTSLSSLDLHYPRTDSWQTSQALGSIVGTDYWELENQPEIAQISMKLNSIHIQTKARKLKTVWTDEASEDMNAYLNVDAEVEITKMLSDLVEKEIDNEILAELVAGAEERGAGVFYWSRRVGKFVNRTTGEDISSATNPPDYTANLNMWYQGLVEVISTLSARIYRKVLKGGANFLVISPEMATVFEMIRGYQASVVHDDEVGDLGWETAGTLSKRWTVYIAPEFRRNVILVGRKGAGFLESGFVYSPYTPLEIYPTLRHPESFVPRKALRTRYATKMVQPFYYGLVIVQDFDG